MVNPSPARPEGFKWASLPAEIRTIILQTIARQKHPGWAALASVCTEWQGVLEHANFQKLKLRVSCLDDFDRVASPQRRRIIRHICLDIKLPRDGVWKLFAILSAWEPAGDLALELNVNVPLDSWRAEARCHDLTHGWLHGRQVAGPPRPAIMKLFQPIFLWFQEPLPRVQAVTCFLMLRTALPGTLKRLTVFEDSYGFYNRFPRRSSHGSWSSPYPEDLRLSARFAFRSRDLQHLSISFTVNAEEFLRQCRPSWNWPHMQSLALTSDLLRQDETLRQHIYALLREAGILAQKMPELHTFVLWNGARGHALSITWRATWRLSLTEDPLVIKEWELAAARLPFPELHIRQQRIYRDISSHGDAVHRLELPCQVVEPASLWQIRREGYRPAR
ncbi:hypothetical protein BBK36DRAFT_1204094 [Trichoderma citrinoviride]|uniref:DUF6546 domain-containing protein n=1 Tax=Trichoderma citrinoviride TaxID=58853 RepID=A0A2T4B6W0_9HYPO|nr:hypothetical protein BBK36DRAFT_1204094 [Trichoderma citrinoviride]PTB65064.1 hypothetical protein BBK36DRAFT_1204094 [Trichoderma citrinoviride]